MNKVTSGASSDIQMATERVAKDMVTKFGNEQGSWPPCVTEPIEDEVFLGRQISSTGTYV